MKSYFTFGDIYLSLWCLYLLQGTLYNADGLIGKALFVIIIIISLYYAFYANVNYKLSGFFTALNALLLMFSIYGFFHIAFGGAYHLYVPTFYYLKVIYLSLLPIYVFYVLVKQGRFDEGKLRVWLLVFCAVATASFFKFQDTFEGEEGTNNVGYVFLSLLPLITIYRKKPLLYSLLLAYCSLFIVASMKRGAIFIGVLVLILLINDLTRDASRKIRISSVVFSSLIIIGIVYYVNYLLLNSDFFLFRINQTVEGGTSSRDVIYSVIIDYLKKQDNLLVLFFGNGADSTLRLFGEYAHNDWLEIAVNNGLIGLIIYVWYYVSFYKVWRESSQSEYKITLGTVLLIVFAKTFFSMSYSNTTIYATCLIGFCMAMLEKPNLRKL